MVPACIKLIKHSPFSKKKNQITYYDKNVGPSTYNGETFSYNGHGPHALQLWSVYYLYRYAYFLCVCNLHTYHRIYIPITIQQQCEYCVLCSEFGSVDYV